MKAFNGAGDKAAPAPVIDSCWTVSAKIMGMYGTLLFLGILLGAVCLFATALIIYYKQISGGYEDRGRFQVMRKRRGRDGGEEDRGPPGSTRVLLPPRRSRAPFPCCFFDSERAAADAAVSDNGIFATRTAVTYIVFADIYLLTFKGAARVYCKIVRLPDRPADAD